MKARLQHPMYTAAALAAANPVLLKGEVVYESDTHKHKIGDGTTAWNALPYESAGGSTPTGPFPGYRQIAGEGSALLQGERNYLHFFTTTLQPEMLMGRHILFDASLSLIENGIESFYHLPAVYQKILGLGNISVVNFTTAHPYLTDSMATIFAFIGWFEYDDTNIIGFHFQTISNGFSKPEILSLKWFGIYLEELPEPAA